jgi:uncharacterized protein YraI
MNREDAHMKLPGMFAAAVLLMTPAAALAAPGMVTASVSLKAGPGAGFPAVDRIPAGARINVHGCIRGGRWCDVSWDGERGWVSARFLEYYYRNHYVYLPDYYEVADVPVVPFVLGSYWSSYYSGRPWYHRQAYWNNYWRSNRFAAEVPVGRGGREVEARTRTEVTPGQRGVVGERGVESRSGRFARGNEAAQGAVGRDVRGRDFRESRQSTVGGREGRSEGNRFGGREVEGRRFEGREGNRFEGRNVEGNRFGGNREGNRFSGAAAGHAMTGPEARPNVGRPGGPGAAPFAAHAQQPPMAAHGQMGGAPRPMGGGMPNAGGGGAPHVNAAPHVGGGGGGPAGGRPGGGGPGEHHH